MASNSITDVNNHHILQEELLFELYVNYCFYTINQTLDIWLDSRWQCLISFESRNHKEAMRLWVDVTYQLEMKLHYYYYHTGVIVL